MLLAALSIADSWQDRCVVCFLLDFQSKINTPVSVFMIIKLLSESPKKHQSFLWIIKELKTHLFPLLGLRVCGEKNAEQGLLTEKRCDRIGQLPVLSTVHMASGTLPIQSPLSGVIFSKCCDAQHISQSPAQTVP